MRTILMCDCRNELFSMPESSGSTDGIDQCKIEEQRPHAGRVTVQAFVVCFTSWGCSTAAESQKSLERSTLTADRCGMLSHIGLAAAGSFANDRTSGLFRTPFCKPLAAWALALAAKSTLILASLAGMLLAVLAGLSPLQACHNCMLGLD